MRRRRPCRRCANSSSTAASKRLSRQTMLTCPRPACSAPKLEANAWLLPPSSALQQELPTSSPARAVLPQGADQGLTPAAGELAAPGPGSAGNTSAHLLPPAAPAAEEPSVAAACGLAPAATPPEAVAAAANGLGNVEPDGQSPGRSGDETPLAPEPVPTAPDAAAEGGPQLADSLESGGRVAAADELMAGGKEALRLAAALEEACAGSGPVRRRQSRADHCASEGRSESRACRRTRMVCLRRLVCTGWRKAR